MAKLIPLVVTAGAVFALTACTTSAPPQSGGPAQANIVTNVHPYKAGSGVVQSVFATPILPDAGKPSEPTQRLEIKMDSGGIQYVDTPSRDFTRGSRVTLTEDRMIRRM